MVAHVDGSALCPDPTWSPTAAGSSVQTAEPAVLVFDVRAPALRRLAAGYIGAWSPTSFPSRSRPGLARSPSSTSPSGAARTLVPTSGRGAPGRRRADGLVSLMDGGCWPSGRPDGPYRHSCRVPSRTVPHDRGELLQFRSPGRPTRTASYSRRLARTRDARSVLDRGCGRVVIGRDRRSGWGPDRSRLVAETARGSPTVSLNRAARPDDLIIVRPDGSGRRPWQTDVGGIVGWSPDGAVITYTTCGQCGWKEVPRSEEVAGLHRSPSPMAPIGRSRARRRVGVRSRPGRRRWISMASQRSACRPRSHEPARDTCRDALPRAPVQPDASWGRLLFGVDRWDAAGNARCTASSRRFTSPPT